MCTALEIACRVEVLVFAPVVAARRALEAGALVEIPVEGWDVREPVTLACSSERVLATEHRKVLDAVTRAIAEPTPPRARRARR